MYLEDQQASTVELQQRKHQSFLIFISIFIMKSGCLYIRDSGYFIDKMKIIGKFPEGSFLVTLHVVSLYPIMLHKVESSSLKNKLEYKPHERFLLMIWLQNLVWKTIFLDLTTKISNRFLVMLLVPSSLLHKPVFIFIKLRQIFWKHRSFSHLHGWNKVTVFFFWTRGKEWRILINFCRTLN